MGRLDKPTNGLLILTNRGDLQNLLCDSKELVKEYICTFGLVPAGVASVLLTEF